MKPAIYFNLCILFILIIFPTLLVSGGVASHIYYKNKIAYRFGSNNRTNSNGEESHFSFLLEFDLISGDTINYKEFDYNYISDIQVDDEGNKYLACRTLYNREDIDCIFLESDFRRKKSESLLITKLSKNNDTIFYSTIIPGTWAILPKIKLDKNNDLYFADFLIPNTYNYPEIPDSLYYVSPDAIQDTIHKYGFWHDAVDYYIGKISKDGRKLDYATFFGSLGDDWLYDFEIADNGDIGVYGFMYPSGRHNGPPVDYVLNGGFPTTSNAFEKSISLEDSLYKDRSISYDFPIWTLAVFSPSEKKVKYGTYFTNGRIIDIGFDRDNNLLVGGWKRPNNIGFPQGSFLAKIDYLHNDIKIKTLSENDWIDTFYLYSKKSHQYYYISEEKNVYFEVDKKGDIFLLAGTNDPNLPVTANAHRAVKNDSVDLSIYKLDKDFNIKYCSYYGSKGVERAFVLTLGRYDYSVFIEGETTDSSNFPEKTYLKKGASYFITEYILGDLGVDVEPMQSFNIYPNPAKDDITIPIEEICGNIEIYNIYGIKMNSEIINGRIEISSYPVGVYTLRTKNKICKFVKI